MLRLLGVPPLFILVIALAVLAFLVYHIVSVGKVQPLTGVALVVVGFALVRVLWQLLRKKPRGNR